MKSFENLSYYVHRCTVCLSKSQQRIVHKEVTIFWKRRTSANYVQCTSEHEPDIQIDDQDWKDENFIEINDDYNIEMQKTDTSKHQLNHSLNDISHDFDILSMSSSVKVEAY